MGGGASKEAAPLKVESKNEKKISPASLPTHDFQILSHLVLDEIKGAAASWSKAGKDTVVEEVANHATMCVNNGSPVSVENIILLQQLNNFITTWGGADHGVTSMYLAGASGSGKSTLLSRAICQSVSKLKEQNVTILLRYIGSTPSSSSSFLLVSSLCRQLHLPPPSTISDIPASLVSLFRTASEDRPLILILDGVDQFWDPRDVELSWLVPALTTGNNPFVRVLISGSGWSSSPAELALRRSLSTIKCITIPSLSDSDAMAILKAGWPDVAHSAVSTAIDAMTPSLLIAFKIARDEFSGVTPLYLRVLTEITLAHQTTSNFQPPASAQECFDICLNLMEGVTPDAGKFLMLITASRDGLTSAELTAAMTGTDTARTMSAIISSAGGGFLKPQKGGAGLEVYKWHHRMIRDVAGYRYLGVVRPVDWLVSPAVGIYVNRLSAYSKLVSGHRHHHYQRPSTSATRNIEADEATPYANDFMDTCRLLVPVLQSFSSNDRKARELPRLLAICGKWSELVTLCRDGELFKSLLHAFGGASGVFSEVSWLRLAAEAALRREELAIDVDDGTTRLEILEAINWLQEIQEFLMECRPQLDVGLNTICLIGVLYRQIYTSDQPDFRKMLLEGFAQSLKNPKAEKFTASILKDDEDQGSVVDVILGDQECIINQQEPHKELEISVSSEGRVIAIVVNDIDLRVFNGLTLKERWTIFEEYDIMSIAVSPSGSYVATSTASGIRVYDAKNGAVLFQIISQPSPETEIDSYSVENHLNNAIDPLSPSDTTDTLLSRISFAADDTLLASEQAGHLLRWDPRKRGAEPDIYQPHRRRGKEVGAGSTRQWKETGRRLQKRGGKMIGRDMLLQRKHALHARSQLQSKTHVAGVLNNEDENVINSHVNDAGEEEETKKINWVPSSGFSVSPDNTCVTWWGGPDAQLSIRASSYLYSSSNSISQQGAPLTHTVVTYEVPPPILNPATIHPRTSASLPPPPPPHVFERWRVDTLHPPRWARHTDSGSYVIVVTGEQGMTVACYGASTGRTLWKVGLMAPCIGSGIDVTSPYSFPSAATALNSVLPGSCIGLGLLGDYDEAVMAVTADGWVVDVSHGRAGARTKLKLESGEVVVAVERLRSGGKIEPDPSTGYPARIRSGDQKLLISTSWGRLFAFSVKPLLKASTSSTQKAFFRRAFMSSISHTVLFRFRPGGPIISLASTGGGPLVPMHLQAGDIERHVAISLKTQSVASIIHIASQGMSLVRVFADGFVESRSESGLSISNKLFTRVCVATSIWRESINDTTPDEDGTRQIVPYVLVADNQAQLKLADATTGVILWTVSEPDLDPGKDALILISVQPALVLLLMKNGELMARCFDSGEPVEGFTSPNLLSVTAGERPDWAIVTSALVTCTDGDDALLIIGSSFGELRSHMVSKKGADRLHTYAAHRGRVTALKLSEKISTCSRWLLSGGEDGAIILWELKDDILRATSSATIACAVTCLDISFVGANTFKAVAGGADGRLHSFNIEMDSN